MSKQDFLNLAEEVYDYGKGRGFADFDLKSALKEIKERIPRNDEIEIVREMVKVVNPKEFNRIKELGKIVYCINPYQYGPTIRFATSLTSPF